MGSGPLPGSRPYNHSMHSHITVKLVPPLLLAGLLTAACSTSADSPAPAAKNSAAATGTRTPSGDRKVSTPRSTPRSSAPVPLKAANGTDVKACADADCEILIHGAIHVPLESRFGVASFGLTYSAPDEVAFVIIRTETSDVHGYVEGTGYIALANGVLVTVKKIDATGAVLRFQPRTMDPHNDKFSGSKGLSTF